MEARRMSSANLCLAHAVVVHDEESIAILQRDGAMRLYTTVTELRREESPAALGTALSAGHQ